MLINNLQKLTSIAATVATFFVTLPNLAYGFGGFDNRTNWEKAVSNYNIITEDFNSLVGNITADTKLPSNLVNKVPFTVNSGEAKSNWAAFDIVFPDEVIAFGFDMIQPWRSPNRDAILGNVKFFDDQNNIVNHLGVQFTSYDENFVGFFLGENSRVRRIEYLWCGVWQGPDQPPGYCKDEYAQQTIDNFSFVTPKSQQKSVPEPDNRLGILGLALLTIGLLKNSQRQRSI
ncbi:hypothetical protein ACE1CI_01110 [Aerosakkonemataceae cyanobacterium BLCC-F50]|uniref:PEP-CTERM sorting domain-containing protein n=1 Tax=Floridaenema flaviceps BLCC-F50 TaxID=3153642 RepID=A0ABV4XIJ1_9CYAN